MASHFSDVSPERIAAWLKASREAADKTQREAADLLDVPSQTVSNWETARHPIDAIDLVRLAMFYHAKVEELTQPPSKPLSPTKQALYEAALAAILARKSAQQPGGQERHG